MGMHEARQIFNRFIQKRRQEEEELFATLQQRHDLPHPPVASVTRLKSKGDKHAKANPTH